MKLIDTHCHIHEAEFFSPEQQLEVYDAARASDIGMVCVATSEAASTEAINFATSHDDSWAVVGVHPHETDHGWAGIGQLLSTHRSDVVGIGEIGLDYFYMNAPRETQIAALEQQLQWAVDYTLPVSFHVRDTTSRENVSVWDDFWPIFDNFSGITGVMHSFTDTSSQLESALSRGLFIGVNGISTFTKSTAQQAMFASIPLEKLLLETDAPFLTPAPFRGRMNQPSFVGRVAEHMATVHGVSLDLVSTTTTANARGLFSI
ncbi:MAG TPA: TatD family hydrolase [Patescibacteria group bacterium]|jgi:TatD DNase family protein|nr:TatD family hydrolase [Patescibacteria group bacterium]